MQQVAAALPADCRANVIIVGSLAAGFHFFGDDGAATMSTKDVDCMISPNLMALRHGKAVAESLLRAQWQPREDDKWGKPGDAATPDDQLPLVRLHPPGNTEWYLELLAAPPPGATQAKTHERLIIERGHFTLCSFRFLSLTEVDPIKTEFGIAMARPEMMALANLLHHSAIGPERIGNTDWKRSNKDLGRVLALAWLATAHEEDAVLAWSAQWQAALQKCFPTEWRQLGSSVGAGLRELLAQPPDLDQATTICNLGLLAGRDISAQMLRATSLRLLQDAIEPLETIART